VTAKLVAHVKQSLLPKVAPQNEKKVKMDNFDDPIPKKSKGKLSKDKPGSFKKLKAHKLYQ